MKSSRSGPECPWLSSTMGMMRDVLIVPLFLVLVVTLLYLGHRLDWEEDLAPDAEPSAGSTPEPADGSMQPIRASHLPSGYDTTAIPSLEMAVAPHRERLGPAPAWPAPGPAELVNQVDLSDDDARAMEARATRDAEPKVGLLLPSLLGGSSPETAGNPDRVLRNSSSTAAGWIIGGHGLVAGRALASDH